MAFGDRGDLCVRARNSGEGDYLLSRVSLGFTVDTWRSARASFVQSMASSGSASLDQFGSAGSSLLHHCHRNVANLTLAVGSSCLLPHVHCDTVGDWFLTLTVSSRYFSTAWCVVAGSGGVRRAGGGFFSSACVRIIIPALLLIISLFKTRCAQTLYTGVLWFSLRVGRPTFWG